MLYPSQMYLLMVERGDVLGFFNLLVVLRKGVFVFGASMCELC